MSSQDQAPERTEPRRNHPHLPVDILERIIDCVGDLFYEQSDVYRQELYTMWKACALTCRDMTPRSQYWIFRNIMIYKKTQAESFAKLLRANADLGAFTRSLTLAGQSTGIKSMGGSWLSYLPLLLAPRMLNLEELWLEGDVFLDCHPSFPMALTAFKSIRRLEIYRTHFTTMGHCFRLIRAFPRLDYLSFEYLTWTKKPLSIMCTAKSIAFSSRSTGSRRLRIAHLDLSNDGVDGSNSSKLFDHLLKMNDWTAFQTLHLEVESVDRVPIGLRCAHYGRSVYVMIDSDETVFGFENLSQLEILHVQFEGETFPLQATTSIITFLASRKLKMLVVYFSPSTSTPEEDQEEPTKDEVDGYGPLDVAICRPVFKDLRLVVCLYGPQSHNAASLWQKKLPTLFPKFHARKSSIVVESAQTEYPYSRWMDFRDGLRDRVM